MTAGVGLFGTFTGFVASMFVEPDIEREKKELVVLADQIRGLRKEIKALDAKIIQSNRNMNQFRKQVLQRKLGRNKPQPPAAENPEV